VDAQAKQDDTSTSKLKRASKRLLFARVSSVSDNNSDDNLVDLIDELQKIETDTPLAKLNETTIADNNGDRILL
jgi:hypothetical protein